ncbi:MAG: [FeFe] hydrogenase H-cluster radical SAM maturase HydE [Clostridia bacterium]|nr:[FeFe] hydrogenase H-cluster radical SAM maturase HydE [Clostridia bacterium]
MEILPEILLNKENLIKILSTNKYDEFLFEKARETALSIFGNKIYIRGLIEFTNYCKNGCYYCGINKENTKAERYRLSLDEILQCCRQGNRLGFKTFVLQGGEDGYYSNAKMTEIIKAIKKEFPNHALTLSIGERSFEAYKSFYDAGADRYLLRHETCTLEHYNKLHPENMSLFNRLNCLKNLKKIGFQTGCGIMIGSPYQTVQNIADDILYMYDFNPQMIGIGPFIPHKDTIFKDMPKGSVEMTLRVLAIMRILLPNVLLPATTALGTLDKNGREKGILAGANVLMPNLSPLRDRKKYSLYDNKICTGEEAAESLEKLKKRIAKIGYEIVSDRGDYKN